LIIIIICNKSININNKTKNNISIFNTNTKKIFKIIIFEGNNNNNNNNK